MSSDRKGELPDQDELFEALEEVGLEEYEPRLAEVYREKEEISYEELRDIALDLRRKWNSIMERYVAEYREKADTMGDYEEMKERHREEGEREGGHPFSGLIEETDELLDASIQMIEGAKQITEGTEENYQHMAEFFQSMEIPESESDPYDILEDIEENAERFEEVAEGEEDDLLSELAALTSVFSLVIRLPVQV